MCGYMYREGLYFPVNIKPGEGCRMSSLFLNFMASVDIGWGPGGKGGVWCGEKCDESQY